MTLHLSAQAVELKVLSGNGSRPAVIELTKQFEQATGHKVSVEFAVNPDVKKKIESGQYFDVTVLNPPVLDQLIQQGKVQANSRAVMGRIGLGAAIKAGAPRPDISTNLIILNAIKFDEMKSKMRPMPGEYNVEVVATGDVDMVVVVASRIFGVPGVDMIGLLPKELQTWIGFATGISSNTQHLQAARDLTRFLTAPEAAKVYTRMGIEPGVE